MIALSHPRIQVIYKCLVISWRMAEVVLLPSKSRIIPSESNALKGEPLSNGQNNKLMLYSILYYILKSPHLLLEDLYLQLDLHLSLLAQVQPQVPISYPHCKGTLISAFFTDGIISAPRLRTHSVHATPHTSHHIIGKTAYSLPVSALMTCTALRQLCNGNSETYSEYL